MHFSFGIDGDAAPCLGPGWSVPEAGFTWAEGGCSRLRLPMVGGQGGLVLEIAVSPLLHPPALASQRVALIVNGVGLAPEAVFGACAVAFEVPEAALAGRSSLDVVLNCPDAASPAVLGAGPDPRVLGVAVHEILLLRVPARPAWAPLMLPPLAADCALPEAVRAATGLALATLAEGFESLGHDCEFGLAQRQMGAERLGLLRFAGISPHTLLLGLDAGFDGIDAPDNVRVFTHDTGPDAEFMLRDSRYGIVLHTQHTPQTISAEALAARMPAHLGLLRRKLTEDLQDGRKICVFNHPAVRSLRQAMPIANLLRSYGDCPLLFVVEDGAQAPGTVARVADDVMQGWVGELGRERAGQRLDLHAWVSLCANAHVLWRDR
jgi:hypothetical protein